MDYDCLRIERAGAVATIRLDRPDKHNALNARLSSEIIAALDELESEQGVNVVVVTGAGEKAFCAGADMTDAAGGDDAQSGAPAPPAEANARVLRTAKPLIAAVNGYAYGGGALLAINCDIRIASENARFRFVGASYGLVVGASRLPQIVGAPAAKELIFTSRTIDAEEAVRMGLVNHVVPLESLNETTMDMAAAIAANSRSAVMASKEVIDLAAGSGDAAQREIDHNAKLRQSEEHRALFRAAAQRVTRGK